MYLYTFITLLKSAMKWRISHAKSLVSTNCPIFFVYSSKEADNALLVIQYKILRT